MALQPDHAPLLCDLAALKRDRLGAIAPPAGSGGASQRQAAPAAAPHRCFRVRLRVGTLTAARATLCAGDAGGARALLDAALALDPASTHALRGLAEVQAAEGDAAGARASYKKVGPASSRTEWHSACAPAASAPARARPPASPPARPWRGGPRAARGAAGACAGARRRGEPVWAGGAVA